MRSVFLTFACLLISAGSTLRAEIPWQENLRDAHAQAKREGKLLLLHFYTDNCHWCEKLEAGAFQSTELAGAIGQHYIPVKVHGGKNPSLAKTFRVSRFPTDVIVTSEGTVLAHGVSPQAAQDFQGMLAKYSGQAPAANMPTQSPLDAGTQIAAAPAPAPAPAQNYGPTQTNQYAAAGPMTQSNPYAQAPAQSQGPARAEAYDAGADAASPQTALGVPAADALAQLPPADKAHPGFALPPGIEGVAAAPAAHRSHSTPDSEFFDLQPPQNNRPASSNLAGGMTAPAAEPLEAPEQAPEQAQEQAQEIEQPPLAMQGYCPVAVIDNDQWLPGQLEFGLIHLGQLYLFSSADAMETFRTTPEKYTPVLNGMDVVLFFEERRLVEGSREWGLKDPEFNRMFFFANEETFNHFYQSHSRYTRSAIEVTRQAAMEANHVTR